MDGIEWTLEEIDFDDIDLINFTRTKREELREETDRDHSLYLLKDAITQGCPETIKEVPTEISYYWSFRDEPGLENAIMSKDPQVVIPLSIQKDILLQLHNAHQRIEKIRLLAGESVLSQNMTKDITEMIQVCEACQETRPANVNEPLNHTRYPVHHGKMGTDLFEIGGVTYLIIAHYFSKYPVTVQINKFSSSAVAMETK